MPYNLEVGFSNYEELLDKRSKDDPSTSNYSKTVFTEDQNQTIDHVYSKLLEHFDSQENEESAQNKANVSKNNILKFLIDSKWNQEITLKRLIEFYQWRVKKDLVQIAKFPPGEIHLPSFEYYFPGTYHGFTKRGEPIYLMRPGLFDPGSFFSPPMTFEHFEKSYFWNTEYGENLLKIAQERFKRPDLHGVAAIIDLTGMGMNVFHPKAISNMQAVVALEEKYFPGHLSKIYIIKQPWIFSKAWNMLKGWLNERTTEKISFLMEPKDLLEFVDEDQLPYFIGGSCTCLNHDCLPFGGVVPPNILVCGDEPLHKDLTVSARGEYRIGIIVPSGVATVEYEISIPKSKHDIGVYFSQGKHEFDNHVLIPLNKSSEKFTGSFKGTSPELKAGSYFLILDNTHSTFSSKSLSIVVTLKGGEIFYKNQMERPESRLD